MLGRGSGVMASHLSSCKSGKESVCWNWRWSVGEETTG